MERKTDEFLKRLKVVHEPNQTEPWVELDYTDYTDLSHFAWFVTTFDNAPQLRAAYQPFFFRGQSSAQWHLQPKLVRLLRDVPLERALRYEYDSVRYFYERAHLFCAALVPADDNFMEWLSLMQHFSAPTRLLDRTSSFTTALYFAVCEEPFDEPGAVWLVQGEPLVRWMREKYGKSDLADKDKSRDILSDADNFVDFGVNRARPFLDGYDPNRKSERVTAQRGVFTICEKLFVDHATIIGEALLQGHATGQTLPLWKIVISPEAKRFFRLYLGKLNITAATLFPGTDGLGRTITEILRVQREAFHGL